MSAMEPLLAFVTLAADDGGLVTADGIALDVTTSGMHVELASQPIELAETATVAVTLVPAGERAIVLLAKCSQIEGTLATIFFVGRSGPSYALLQNRLARS